MADVVDIALYRKKKSPPSPQEVIAFCTEDVMGNWERFAKTNRLNDFFNSSIGMHAKPLTNWLGDLDEISKLEQRLSLQPGIWAPGMQGSAQIGWRACFRFGDMLVETTDMAFEEHARCANILVFLKIKREMVAINRTT